jgi:hypothetical protein
MATSDTILCAKGSPYQPDYACVLTPGHGEGHCFVPMAELYAELERRQTMIHDVEDRHYDRVMEWLESVLQPIRDTPNHLTGDDAVGMIDAALDARQSRACAKVTKT